MEQQNQGVLPPGHAERQNAVVLVHGAWVGEWSWLPVVPTLAASGRPVHSVSLTGHGARRHDSGPDISLDQHAADVAGLVETLDLTEVTLVGHSYGGRVITAAAPRLADRLAAMVFLDAHTPVTDDPGQTPERIAAAERNGGMLPFPDEYLPDRSLLGEDGLAWFCDRLEPQSFACFSTPWVRPLPEGIRKTFVFATGYQPTRFGAYAELCRNDPDWAYHELDGPHFLMFSHPGDVARIILQA